VTAAVRQSKSGIRGTQFDCHVARDSGPDYNARKENMMKLTAVFMAVPEGYIGFVEELPGANTQGDTLEETRENLQEAVQMVLEANRELAAKAIAGKTVSREPFDLTSQ
jgi:predicted RNase H-like HicB family nuclease